MAKKTYNEKLHNAGDLPKVEPISEKTRQIKLGGAETMLIAAPVQYNDIMRKIPEGKLTTIDRIRAYLAKEAGADITCPLTAGIFMNICAHASAERDDDKIPYWRTLRAKGELNEKYPDGIDGQKLRLEAEGHTVAQKGKRYFVADYEESLADLERILT